MESMIRDAGNPDNIRIRTRKIMVRLLYDKSNKCSTQTVRQKSLDIGIYVPMGRLIGYFSFM
jgi:hypothetical protein